MLRKIRDQMRVTQSISPIGIGRNLAALPPSHTTLHRMQYKNNLNNIEPHKINRRRNMTIVTLCAVFGVAGGTCISNNVLSLVAIKLGAGDIYLGLLAAAFTAPLVLGIFSMKAIEKHGKLKILIPWTAASTILVMLYMLI